MQERFSKILSDDHIFPDFSYENLNFITYNYDYNLDDDTWFQIENLKNQDFCPKFWITQIYLIQKCLVK